MKNNERGFALLGLVLLTASIPVIAYITMMFVENTSKASRLQKSMSTKQRMSVIRDYLIANAKNPDNDSYFETLAPGSGNLVPSSVPANSKDEWGTDITYCAWDNGDVNTDTNYATTPAIDSTNCGAGTNSQSCVAFVLISAGRNKIFDTTCDQAYAGNSNGDDIMFVVRESDIRFSSAGIGGWVDDGDVVRLLNSNDRVGIGTNTPDAFAKLHIFEDVGTSGTADITLESNARKWQLGVKGTNENGSFILYDATAGLRRITVNSTGNVGIGTTNPQAKLTINYPNETQTGYTAEFISSPITAGAGGILFSQNSTYAYKWYTTGTGATTGTLHLDYIERATGNVVYKDALAIRDGNLGIGAVSSFVKLYVYGAFDSSNNSIRITDSTSGGFIAVKDGTSASSDFVPLIYGKGVDNSGWSYRVGLYLIGEPGSDSTRNPAVVIDGRTNGTTLSSSPVLRVTNFGNLMFQIYPNGNAYLAGTLTQGSDIRLKEKIEEIPDVLEKIEKLSGYYYQWNDKARDYGILEEGRQVGLIAQEVEKVFPELVKEIELCKAVKDADDKKANCKKFKALDYPKMVAILVQAVKEEHQKVKALETKVQKLEERLKKIEEERSSQLDLAILYAGISIAIVLSIFSITRRRG